MAKGAREKIKMESSAGTGYFVTTTKNKKTSTGKLERNMFDPVARKHVLFKETKSLILAVSQRCASVDDPENRLLSDASAVGFFVVGKKRRPKGRISRIIFCGEDRSSP